MRASNDDQLIGSASGFVPGATAGDIPVVVVGAGPAGLMLAGELRLAGVGVVVLERLAERSGESRGIGFTTRTMEVFDQRGLLPRFGDVVTSTGAHFGGLPLDLAVLGAGHRAARTVPQAVTEQVLETWARELGADVRRGHEVVAIEEETCAVAVAVSGATRPLRARFVVGADGGRSVVRRTAGFDFPGTPATTEMLLADFRGVDVEPRMRAETNEAGVVLAAALPGGVHRIIVGEHGAPPVRRTEPPAFAEVAAVWKRVTGEDVSAAEPVWVSAFGDAARLATEYRRGRVLLVGDAAHVHLPVGGQGMNTGVQDAVNLGWKLAAEARGTAPAELLDTYHVERHAVGERLLTSTRAQSTLIFGGTDVGPLREILGELLTHPEVQHHLAARVSGTDIRYEVGGGTHPLLGSRVPPITLTALGRDTTVATLLRRGRGVLLDLLDNPRLRARVAGFTDRVDLVTATATGPVRLPAGTAALLIRPDGHVAWAAPGSHDDLTTALRRWFGAPV